MILTYFLSQQLIFVEELSWCGWITEWINRSVFFCDFCGDWCVKKFLGFCQTFNDVTFKQEIFCVAKSDVRTFMLILATNLSIIHSSLNDQKNCFGDFQSNLHVRQIEQILFIFRVCFRRFTINIRCHCS